jgi:hypothetical protein
MDTIINQIYIEGDTLVIPAVLWLPDRLEFIIWAYDMAQDRNSIVFDLYVFADMEQVSRFYEQPYGRVYETEDNLVFFEGKRNSLELNILSQTNHTQYVFDNGEISGPIIAGMGSAEYDCLSSEYCRFYKVHEIPMFFQLNQSTNTIIRKYNGQEDVIPITDEHILLSFENVYLDNMAMLATTLNDSEGPNKNSDYLHLTLVSGDKIQDSKVLINPDDFRFPRYTALPRDDRSFYVITSNFTLEQGATNFVLNTIHIGALKNLDQWSGMLWKYSLPASVILTLIIIYFYRRGKKIEGKLYPKF